MLNRRRKGDAAQLTADRRRREDDAPRLLVEVPRLSSLNLEIDEGGAGGASGGATHIRRIVVERAPALFVIGCSGTDCTGGVHDFTDDVMRALHQGATRFEGASTCAGSAIPGGCRCVLRYVGAAVYR